MEYAREFPALMKDGQPLSWRHFVYGMAHLSRVNARESLKLASSTRIASAEKKDFTEWMSTQTFVAGWR